MLIERYERELLIEGKEGDWWSECVTRKEERKRHRERMSEMEREGESF